VSKRETETVRESVCGEGELVCERKSERYRDIKIQRETLRDGERQKV
jgi:hypothetical protein